MKAEIKICDVRGLKKDVASYTAGIVDEQGISIFEISVDLCPWALARLKHFIEKGCTKPKKKKATALAKLL